MYPCLGQVGLEQSYVVALAGQGIPCFASPIVFKRLGLGDAVGDLGRAGKWGLIDAIDGKVCYSLAHRLVSRSCSRIRCSILKIPFYLLACTGLLQLCELFSARVRA